MTESAIIQQNQRILYPDILRTLAVFAVIAIHVCAYGICNYDVSSFEWQITNVYYCLTRWAVPVFVMISGMFFLNPHKEISLSKLYRKNIFRLAVAIFFWGFLYQAANVVKRISLENADTNSAIMDALKEYLLGPTWYHLWFLYMIIGLYVFVPLIRIFTQNAKEKHYHYLFILFITLGSMLPLLQESLFLIDKSFKIGFMFKELLGYSCYFILGYYLSSFSISSKIRLVTYLIAGIAILFQIIGTSLLSIEHGQAITILYTDFTPCSIFQSIAIFLFIKECGTRINVSDRSLKIIGMLGKYSFGMYLVHDFFNGFFYRIGFSSMNLSPFFSIPFRTIITFIACFFVVFILSKIPIIKKYCI